jgi:hypothetical protein
VVSEVFPDVPTPSELRGSEATAEVATSIPEPLEAQLLSAAGLRILLEDRHSHRSWLDRLNVFFETSAEAVEKKIQQALAEEETRLRTLIGSIETQARSEWENLPGARASADCAEVLRSLALVSTIEGTSLVALECPVYVREQTLQAVRAARETLAPDDKLCKTARQLELAVADIYAFCDSKEDDIGTVWFCQLGAVEPAREAGQAYAAAVWELYGPVPPLSTWMLNPRM